MASELFSVPKISIIFKSKVNKELSSANIIYSIAVYLICITYHKYVIFTSKILNK